MAISDYSATEALNTTVPGTPPIEIGKGNHSPQGHDIQRQAIQRIMADAKTFSAEVTESLALLGANPVSVATRTALKALDTSKNTTAYLIESGRAGQFIFRAGNYSSLVTLDTEEGLYIAADDTASSTGAWVRQRNSLDVAVEWFGAVGDGTTDDSAAIQAAIDMASGAPVRLEAKTYIVEGLSLPQKSHIRGVSDQMSILMRKTGSTTFVMASDNYILNDAATDLGSVLHDFKIDGNKPDSTYAAGQDGLILRTYRSSVERVRVTNCAGHGLLLTAASADGTALSNGMAENRIVNNRFDSNNGSGIYGRNDSNQHLADAFIRGNAVSGNGGTTYYNIESERSAGFHVLDNQVYGASKGCVKLLLAGAITFLGNNLDSTACAVAAGTQYNTYLSFAGDVCGSISGNVLIDRRASATGGVTYTHLYVAKASGTTLGIVHSGNSYSFRTISGNAIEFSGIGQTTGFQEGANTYYNCTRIYPQHTVLAQSAVAVSHTGDTTETALATITIPANAMGSNGRLRITSVWSATNNANAKSSRTRFSSISGTSFLTEAWVSIATRRSQVDIFNVNSASSQKGAINGGATAGGWGSGGSTPVTASVNTAVDTTVVLSAQLTNSGDTMTLESYTVELLLP